MEEGCVGEMNKNLELEKLGLIDISSEDDFLIDSQLCDSFEGFRFSVALENRDKSDYFEPFPAGNRQKVVNAADVFGQSKLESGRDGECNLRKSLAWDSAFFTSAGVLDPEELSMLNKGFRKTEKHLLPGIEEELQASADSNCTIGSNGFFENLEIDLFKDLREKNQKSRKTSLVASSRRVSGKGAAKKKLEVAPRNMHNARTMESNSTSIRPPKLSGRSGLISATPTKRTSFGTSIPEHMMASKKHCLGNSCNATPGSTKSYSSGSSTLTSVTVSCSSYDRSGNGSSDNTTGKSPWNPLRRKFDSGNVDQASLGSQTGTLRCSIRNKSNLEISSNPTYKSMPKLSYCLSPASSMDRGSSGSSSSSMNYRRPKITKSIMDVTPSKGELFDCHATRASELESQAGTSPVSADVSSNFKPSGLRWPSPKIGYFDVENSPLLTPKELKFNGEQGTLHNSGTRINNLKGASNGAIHRKLQLVRTVTDSEPKKLPSPSLALGISPANTCQFRKLKNASQEVSVRSGNRKTSLSMASKFQTSLSPEMMPQGCLKTKEVRRRLHVSSESGLGLSSKSDEKGTQRSLKNRKGVVQSNRQIQLKANNSGRSKDGHTRNRSNPAKKVHEEGSQHLLENRHHSPYATGKENLFRYEDQVEGLSRHLGSIDLSDVGIEL